jgi:hypothetical protein
LTSATACLNCAGLRPSSPAAAGDLSQLDIEHHFNAVVTTRKYLRANEDTVRRFLRAYIEGAVRGMKDKAFAMKTMGKYFRTDNREPLEETYEMIIKTGFSVPPYAAGIGSLRRTWKRPTPRPTAAAPRTRSERVYQIGAGCPVKTR